MIHCLLRLFVTLNPVSDLICIELDNTRPMAN